jgi:HK97 family phage prohead protease
MKFETRGGLPAITEKRKSGYHVEGLAAVYGEEARIGDLFREVIAPGAFNGALEGSDVIFNVNHGGLPLARTSSGSLVLTLDERGLHMSTDLSESDPDVMQIVPKMERGDLSKMSFAFSVDAEEWDERGDDLPLRTITSIARVFDVSIVTDPAYGGTEIGLRSLDAHRSQQNFDATRRRKRRMAMHLALDGQENGPG